MHVKIVLLIAGLFFLGTKLHAQDDPPPPVSCTAIGQTPLTAIPICGTDPIVQGTVGLCGGKPVTTICFSGLKSFVERNPSWYKFTCYGDGTLGFDIKPNDLNDDYDWEIFDITGKDPGGVYGNINSLVASNWSYMPGYTGTRDHLIEGKYGCNYDIPKPRTYSEMPLLKAGHNYLLLVNHSGDVQSGFTLTFGKGTAIIKDPLEPSLKAANTNCLGTQVRVKLNKKMKCSSIAANGSDFDITPAAASIISAQGIFCIRSLDMDSVELTLDHALPAGDYTLTIKNGIDGNSLLDNCGLSIPVGNQVTFTVYPVSASVLDSISAPGCSPTQIQLVFKQDINCSSIAPDGSDFRITGPASVNIISASSECENTVNYILLTLAAPLLQPGVYTVALQKGSDGNTIINQCGLESNEGISLDFTAKASVPGKFTYQVLEGCKYDTVLLFNEGAGVTEWNWTFNNTQTSNLQNPQIIYTETGIKRIKLVVTNGSCSDSSTVTLTLADHSHAAFDAPAALCPLDTAVFKNTSTGNIVAWNWDFGNGMHSSVKDPSVQRYPFYSRDTYVPVYLVLKDNKDCFDTAIKQVKIFYNCYIAVPTAFTPNSDGRNDYLYPLNAYKADNLEFRVYNRYGQLVFNTKDWTRKWDGAINGTPQDSGVYIWVLQYTEHDTGKFVSQRGTTLLMR